MNLQAGQVQIPLVKNTNKHYRILTFTQKDKKVVNTNKIDQYEYILPGTILHMTFGGRKFIKMYYKGTLNTP